MCIQRAMAAKAFLEQYMDCMDGLPLDLQRYASQYWEIDNRTQDVITEAQRIHTESDNVLTNEATPKDKIKWLIQLQRLMVSMVDIGSEKLEVTSDMLDTVEEYSQKLTLAEKEMTSCRTRDELLGGSARNNSGSTHSQHKTSVQPSLPVLLEVVEKKKAERNQKRPRAPLDKSDDNDIPPPVSSSKEAKRDSNASITSTIIPSLSTNTQSVNVQMKSLKKKKVKRNRNCIVKEQQQNSSQHHQSQPVTAVPSVSAAVPTPDFTTEPIDPDEPTYCLCNQVSFGEMIGCDNDDCTIEWFHFQCVGLTAKPKGKWYCPQCQSERSKNRSTKT